MLFRSLSQKFDSAERIVSLHSGPRPIDHALLDTAKEEGWKVHYASHETRHLELYKESDLHVGYRLHGHLAHLRWKRPSIALAEDSRIQGLTETFGTGGVSAAIPRGPSCPGGKLRWLSKTRPLIATHLIFNKVGMINTIPYNSPLKAKPNHRAVDQILDFIEDQLSNDWSSFTKIRDVIDNTYQNAMYPHLESIL